MITRKIKPVFVLNHEVNCVRIHLTQYDLGGSTCRLTFHLGYTNEEQAPLQLPTEVFVSVMSGSWTPSQEVFDSWGVDDAVLLDGFMAERGLENEEAAPEAP